MKTGAKPIRMGLPRGSKDLLPPAASRRRALIQGLLDAFSAWGYRQVVTPTVERFDVLAAGLSRADRTAAVRFIAAHTGEVVALRSDVTPQIARMIAEHRGETWSTAGVLRLSYAADVVRQPSDDRQRAEHHQVGVELVGDADPAADAELMALSHAALVGVGLGGFRFDLSHRAVARGTLDALGLPPHAVAAVERSLARKDRGGVEALSRSLGVDSDAVAALGSLCDLYGDPTVLTRAHDVLHAPQAREGLANLAAIVDHLQQTHPEAADALHVDLGEVRGFDYYTGTRLRVWAPGVARPVLRGGRYDDLIGRYGDGAPATGFALDLDALEQALGDDAAPLLGPPARLVALHPGCPPVARVEAATRAAAARAGGERAWVQADVSLEQARALALESDAQVLNYLEPTDDGGVAVHALRRADDTWIPE